MRLCRQDNVRRLEEFCDEFLVHGVDVEGKRCGIDVSGGRGDGASRCHVGRGLCWARAWGRPTRRACWHAAAHTSRALMEAREGRATTRLCTCVAA